MKLERPDLSEAGPAVEGHRRGIVGADDDLGDGHAPPFDLGQEALDEEHTDMAATPARIDGDGEKLGPGRIVGSLGPDSVTPDSVTPDSVAPDAVAQRLPHPGEGRQQLRERGDAGDEALTKSEAAVEGAQIEGTSQETGDRWEAGSGDAVGGAVGDEEKGIGSLGHAPVEMAEEAGTQVGQEPFGDQIGVESGGGVGVGRRPQPDRDRDVSGRFVHRRHITGRPGERRGPW
jgi:hypothetical protein